MADPLTQLQKFHRETRPILEENNFIIFGDLAWPKDVKTNFRIYGSESDGQWDYYTLECLLYFLKNIKRSHPDYVKQARGEVPIVHRPDRRDLIAFLEGNMQRKDVKSIDNAARMQMPTNYKRVTAISSEANKLSTSSSTIESSLGPPSKKLRTSNNATGNTFVDSRDESGQSKKISHKNSNDGLSSGAIGQLKERLAAKLESRQNEPKLAINTSNLKNLSDDLTKDKIAEIRAKLISNRRTRIKPEEDESGKMGSSSLGGLGDIAEVGREVRDITNRERVWRNRTTILQSSGKTFNKSVMSILSAIKCREEGGKSSANKSSSRTNMPPPSSIPPNRQPMRHQPYNRYDQERFGGKDDTHGFNIETTGTFSGMTLKSVTEGNAAQQLKGKPSSGVSKSMPPPSMVSSRSGPTGSASPALSNAPSSQPGKRPSRTPIIVIPAAPKSLISMYNAKDILQDLKFVSTEDKKAQGGKRDNELLIQRRKEGGLTVPYRVIDNPSKLNNAEWERVVAVFVMGQAWQFKGWPWEGNPTVIFSKVAAFHLKWDESNLEGNISKWAVKVIQLSREKRHLDRARLMTIWESLDRYIMNNKPHLRY